MRRTNEHGALTEPRREVPQPIGDAAVQMTDGRVLLAARESFAWVDRVAGWSSLDEIGAVVALHSFGPFEEQEVIEGLVAERQQVESHLCREVTRSLREVRTSG